MKPLTLNCRICLSFLCFMLLVACGAPRIGVAQQATDSPELTALEVVASDLSEPCSLAVRPGGQRSGPGLLFVDQGTGRVLGISTDDDKPELMVVLEGFAPQLGPAPSSIMFRMRNGLLVALPGDADHKPEVCEFDVDDDKLPIDASNGKAILTYASEGPASLTAMDLDRSTLVATTGPLHWLLTGKIQKGPAVAFKLFMNTAEASHVGTPTSLVFSSKGYLVVAEAGSDDQSGTSHLVFYHPVNQTSPPLMKLDTGLAHITDIAYSPTTDNLFATNYAADDPQRSGLYRLEAKYDPATQQQLCTAVQVAQVAHPTSLAFTSKGVLYLTDASEGTLLKGPSDF